MTTLPLVHERLICHDLTQRPASPVIVHLLCEFLKGARAVKWVAEDEEAGRGDSMKEFVVKTDFFGTYHDIPDMHLGNECHFDSSFGDNVHPLRIALATRWVGLFN